MPRINDRLLGSSVYFYPSEDAARAGAGTGGSGFFVHVASTHPGQIYLYVVTARHVIDRGNLVLRVNTTDGRMDTLLTEVDSWCLHPAGDDIAPAGGARRRLSQLAAGGVPRCPPVLDVADRFEVDRGPLRMCRRTMGAPLDGSAPVGVRGGRGRRARRRGAGHLLPR